MKKINILYLVSSLKKCGPINVLFGIVKNLDKGHFNIHIVCLSKENKSSMKNDFMDLGCKILNLDNSRLKGIIKNERMVDSFIKNNHIDIVHSHGLRGDLINASLKSIKKYSTIHNFPDEDYIIQNGRLKGALMASKHRQAFRGIEHLVACSGYIQKRFLLQYGLQSICIQNGIDTDLTFDNSLVSTEELRKNLGLPINKKIFVVSGSLIKRKDPETILKAFSKINTDSCCMVLLGSGKLEKRLKKSYQNDSIIFKGNISNVMNYLLVSDFFVSASVSEGLPNAVMEAMFAGLGVILSDIPSHIEIVGENYPFLFQLHNPNVLKDKMEAIQIEDHEGLRMSNKALITSHFNASSMAKEYQKIYLQRCQATEE